MANTTITRREAAALINSLTSGVTPRIGLRHIAVGRKREVGAFLQDLTTIEEGGAAFRFVCGRYGSGKSFLLQMIRNNAMEQGFVVADADLSPERRLIGTHEEKQGLATYKELMQHMATQVRPEGGALESILQKWVSYIQSAAISEKSLTPGTPEVVDVVDTKISQTLLRLSEMSFGFVFSAVLSSYWKSIKSDNEETKQATLRWIRGEYMTKTEARQFLPVDCIIDDSNWYDFLKLFAVFVCQAGYKGLLLFLDEGVNLYKINHRKSRENNYEKLLTIFNDMRQGNARHIGMFLSGTPQFIYDEQRGLFSYEALRSRLAESRFAAQGTVDYTGPIIKLEQLSPEEVYILLERVCEVHAAYYSRPCTLGKAELTKFLEVMFSKLGSDQLLTTREMIRDFLGLLNILGQKPETNIESLILDLGLAGKKETLNTEEEYAEETKESNGPFFELNL